MKKNKMMRVASILLVAVLLTTSVISGTFAKYVTSGEASDSARVAKFGVLVSAEGNLFDKTYKKTTDNTPGGSTWDENLTGEPKDLTALSVESTTNVVAPGTKSEGTGLTFGVTGTPEVDVNVKLDFTAVKDVFLAANDALPDMTKAAYTGTFGFTGDEYHPIVFTLAGDYIKALVDKTSTVFNATGVTYNAATKSISGTLAQIKAAFDVINGNGNGIFVDANTDLANVANGGIGEFVLTWEWKFEEYTATEMTSFVEATTGDGDKSTEIAALEAAQAAFKLRDQKDTLLGDIAAGIVIEKTNEDAQGKTQLPQDYTKANNSYSTDVDVALTISVTQVD